MSFASHEFIFGFLPFALAVVLCASAIDRERLLLPALILVSAVFYGIGSAPHLLLLLALIALTYAASLFIKRRNAETLGSRFALTFGVMANLGALGVWKYGNSMVVLWNDVGLPNVALPGIIMPLGISFYAFQQIGYLMDIRRGRASRLPVVEYVAFVLFFPQLIAGPIVTQRRMHREFVKAKTGLPTPRRLELAWLGVAWFGFGLFKKVVLADGIGHIIAPAMSNAVFRQPSGLDAWQIMAAGPTQIYFDFCGYSDMAVGLALLFGIRIPPNFNAPYRSRTAREFWKRWHITFHQFVRDHLYAPLIRRWGSATIAGRQVGAGAALLVTVVLSSLWHGNSVQFLIWGLLLWFSIVGSSLLYSRVEPRLRRILSMGTLVAVFGAMSILFTTPDLDTALGVMRALFKPPSPGITVSDAAPLAVLAGLIFAARHEISTQVLLESSRTHRDRHVLGWRPPLFRASIGWILVVIGLYLASFPLIGRAPDFIYFGI